MKTSIISEEAEQDGAEKGNSLKSRCPEPPAIDYDVSSLKPGQGPGKAQFQAEGISG